MRISAAIEEFQLKSAFAISRGSRNLAAVVSVKVESDGIVGRGECVPYARYGESPERVLEAVLDLPAPITRGELQEALRPGAARNAVDCAMWDWEAKRFGKRVWQLAGMPEPRPLPTAYTLSLDEPAVMKRSAQENSFRPLLKIKLGSANDIERLEAVRSGAAKSSIIVDANEGWEPEEFREIIPHLERLRVLMVEQPCPVEKDDELTGLEYEFDICADESCHDRSSLPGLVGKYSMVNVKLDKTGGLTEAFALIRKAKTVGFKVMVGCMIGTSLGTAPATLAAQGAEIVDLDAPLFIADDREPALVYRDCEVYAPDTRLWG
ncbi:MAG: dipeptide epimerase [Albidovulum sp.]|nr:dipeptide epimerase [Albidovulum sp.]MDE0531857.1 dipeptide epimerase [Albidovulum sp.]